MIGALNHRGGPAKRLLEHHQTLGYVHGRGHPNALALRAYIGVGGLHGAPVALDAMDQFYDHVTKTYGLNPKTVLEGFSRGGLYALN